MNIGNRINQLLKLRKISRKEIAEQLNISYSAVSKYITNQRTPDATTLKEIADFLNVSTDYLLGRDMDGQAIDPACVFHQAEKLDDHDFNIIQSLIDRLVDD
jgi:transcriptional regulator with XRE-family HTH domain